MDWNLADAKNRFSELFNQAIAVGPQRVRHRKEAVIILSERDYERVAGRRPGFKDYLRDGESFEGLDLSRDLDPDPVPGPGPGRDGTP